MLLKVQSPPHVILPHNTHLFLWLLSYPSVPRDVCCIHIWRKTQNRRLTLGMCFENYSTLKDILYWPNLSLIYTWLFINCISFLFSVRQGPQQTRNRCLINRGKSMYTNTHRHYSSWKLMLVEVLFIRVHSHNRIEEHLNQRSDFTR